MHFVGVDGRFPIVSFVAYYYQESISCLVQEYIQLEAAEIDPESRSGFRHLIASSLEEEYKE